MSGYKPYSVSMSNRDNYDGTRLYYMIKDLDVNYKMDDITDEHIITMVDVDYYLNVNDYMKYFRPILIYTFVPTTVAGRNKESSWFIENDKINFQVNGGALYQHQIWDYNGDTISVIDDDWNLLTFHINQYEIEHPSLPCQNRRIIILIPKTRTKYPYYTFMKYRNGIKYRKFLQNKMVNIIYNATTDILSIAKDGEKHSVQIPGKMYVSLSKKILQKQKPLPVDIERMLFSMEYKNSNPSLDAMFLFEILGYHLHNNIPDTNQVATHFQTLAPLIHEEGETSGRCISAPLVRFPSTYPMKSYNNDIITVKHRVTDVANNVTPPKIYTIYRDEFLKLLVTDKYKSTGEPYDVDYIVDIQNKPRQISRSKIVQDIMGLNNHVKIMAFQKAESYQNIKAPRNISSVSTELTLQLSCFAKKFKEHCLNKQPWYAPGKNPKQIERRLYTLFRNEFKMVTTDFDKMDGRVSKWLQQEVVTTIYSSWVHDKHRTELLQLLKRLHNATAVTAGGVKYKPGYSVKSGSPITTDGNTIINAFIFYCALRKCGNGEFAAWSKIGLVCGDDGIIPEYGNCADMCELVARELGMVIKSEVHSNMDPIPYCGRYFYIDNVNIVSFADPMRTISKLHLTAKSPLSDEQCLVNKACGYIVTDTQTPIISDWCRRIFQLYPNVTPKAMTDDQLFKLEHPWNQAPCMQMFSKVIGIDTALIINLIQEISKSDLKQSFKHVLPNFSETTKINVQQDNKLLITPKQKDFQKHKPIIIKRGNFNNYNRKRDSHFNNYNKNKTFQRGDV